MDFRYEARPSMRCPSRAGTHGSKRTAFVAVLPEFRNRLSAVIATSAGGERFGSHLELFHLVSLEPPLVLWSIRRESKSFAAFAGCSHFASTFSPRTRSNCRNVLPGRDPTSSGSRLQLPGRGTRPCSRAWQPPSNASVTRPTMAAITSFLSARSCATVRYDRQPLLFVKGRYAVSADHPDTRVFAATESQDYLKMAMNACFLNLMIRAYSAIAARLERGRQRQVSGSRWMQARLLRAAATSPIARSMN